MKTGNNQTIIKGLLTRLTVTKKKGLTFQGARQRYRSGNVFGGQIVGQALSAAYQTVQDDRWIHSLHAYFIRPSDPNIPIIYDVQRVRNGASFDTRHVTAYQNRTAVFTMLASFQTDGQGPDHQDMMPEIPGPEQCSRTLPDQDKMLADMPLQLKKRLIYENPIDIRYVHPSSLPASNGNGYDRYMWFRAVSPIAESHSAHHLVLAYVTDYSLVATLLYRHGFSFWDKQVQVASLDHAIWFHRNFRMDDWLLYTIHSPTACNARGLCLAHIFNGSKELVATVAQEGLIRFAE